MKAEQAKQQGYTHRGKIYGVKIYMTDNEATNVIGTNWFNDQLLAFFIWFDVNFTDNDGFMILKGAKLCLFPFLLLLSTFAVGQTVKHHAFTVYFNAKQHCPDSTSWDLTPQMLGCSKVIRVDNFAADHLLKGSPKPSDFVQLPAYKTDKTVEGAKGHLFSYEDAMCNPIDNTECFLVDQMYWQYQQFNAGDWKTVEVYERQLASKGKIHVIAGFCGTITQHVSSGLPIVPYMYKAIYSGGKWVCWIMPNLPNTKGHHWDYWLASKSDLDSKTGLKL